MPEVNRRRSAWIGAVRRGSAHERDFALFTNFVIDLRSRRRNFRIL